MKRGYWKLTYNEVDDGFGEMDDNDKEHVSRLVKEGYIEGELIHHEENES